MAVYGKDVMDLFTSDVEMVKKEKHFDSYMESILYIIELGTYAKEPGITATNIKLFLNKAIKEKIFVEACDRNMIKEEHVCKFKEKLV